MDKALRDLIIVIIVLLCTKACMYGIKVQDIRSGCGRPRPWINCLLACKMHISECVCVCVYVHWLLFEIELRTALINSGLPA